MSYLYRDMPATRHTEKTPTAPVANPPADKRATATRKQNSTVMIPVESSLNVTVASASSFQDQVL